MTKSGHKRS